MHPTLFFSLFYLYLWALNYFCWTAGIPLKTTFILINKNSIMKKNYIIALGCLFFFINKTNAQTTLNVSATQDNTIYSELPGNSNGAGPNFTTGSTSSTLNVRRALIRFDLSSIPSGATITAATLTLNMNKTASGPADVSLYQVSAAWGEGTSDAGSGADGLGALATTSDVTWPCSFAVAGGGCVTPWTIPGADFLTTVSATTSVSNTGPYMWSSAQVVADIQSWITTPATNFGWIIIGDETNLRMAKRFDSRESATPANRPSLSVTFTAALPVSLLSFAAKIESYGTRLQWQTAQEINNDHFVIEHSTDGQQFSAIGSTPGAGNSSVVKSYQYIHQLKDEGIHYYRLVQVDISGQKHYSEIKVVKFGLEKPVLLISPNPVQDKISLPGFLPKIGDRYLVVNMNGQKLSEGAMPGNSVRLPVAMKPGIYQLRIFSADGTSNAVTFMKQ